MIIRFFNPGLTYKRKERKFNTAMHKVLKAGDLILRDEVERFEKRLAEFLNVKYAVGLNSCTDALYLALRALKIGPGDEVIVPSRTFVATAQVIVQVGATPVYMDIDKKFEITPKTKAIIPVHIEGAMWDPDMKLLVDEMRKQGVAVIEDAAQALGANQNGKMAGTFGIAGCYSFYPAKILGAFGDAGALVTNDEKIYKWVRDARNHFKEDARDWGVNSRLDNLQAAILNIRMDDLFKNLLKREEVATIYSAYLKNIPGLTLPEDTLGRVWQDYVIRTKRRDELQAFLKEQGIETLKNNYPFPVAKLPQAQKYEDETLRLPCNPELNNREIGYVAIKIKQFFHG